MPIRPENKNRYPANWKQIRAQILERAGHRCEFCGAGNHEVGYRKDERWIRVTEKGSAPNWEKLRAAGLTWIVLTVAHLDHTPENCDPKNLRALCQKCHLQLDMETHVRNRKRGQYERLEKAGQQVLIGRES